MGKRHGHKKKSKLWLLPLILLLLLLLIVGGVAVMFTHYYGLMQYESGNAETAANQGAAVNEAVESFVEPTGLTDSEVKALQEQNQQIQNAVTLPVNDSVYNLLLVGVDRRDASWSGNSDSMILMSINKKTKKIHMVSLMRDLYADIPGHGVRKLNAACAYGGCSLLVSTIESNYGVNIDNYAWVDFGSMIDIVDAIGGVELTLSDDEVKVGNGYVKEMCDLNHEDYLQHTFPKGGTYICDGYQAVAYGRIRYVGNSDYQRTERQRTVLTKIMEKANKMSVTELNSVATKVLPLVHHDISSTDMVSLLASAPTLLNYDVQQSRIPYDNMYSVKGEILVPDMQATITKLQQELYQ